MNLMNWVKNIHANRTWGLWQTRVMLRPLSYLRGSKSQQISHISAGVRNTNTLDMNTEVTMKIYLIMEQYFYGCWCLLFIWYITKGEETLFLTFSWKCWFLVSGNNNLIINLNDHLYGREHYWLKRYHFQINKEKRIRKIKEIIENVLK